MLSRRSLLGLAASATLSGLVMPEVDATGVAVRAERHKAFLGLIEPPVSVSRLLDHPGIMASPPVITLGGYGAAATISGKTFQESSDVFRYLAATAPVLENASWYKAGPNTNYWAVDFEIDCQAFEVQSQGSAGPSKFRLIVDGEYHDADLELGQTGAGGTYFFKVDFGSKAMRHVVIEGDLNFKFGGLTMANTDHVWLSSTPAGPRVVWLGDSYTEGAMDGTTYGPYGMAVEASKLLGWRDIQADGQGGTGYLKANGSKPAFRDRLATNIVAPNPDIVIVFGGINDSGSFTGAAIQAEAEYVFDEIRSSLPSAVLIVIGNPNVSGTLGATTAATRDVLKAAAVGRAHLFIDPLGGASAGSSTLGWITGTGKAGATNGSGNSDIYISNDAVHPTRAGHRYYGSRIAQAIAKWTRAGSPFGATHAGNTLTVP